MVQISAFFNQENSKAHKICLFLYILQNSLLSLQPKIEREEIAGKEE